VYPPSCQTCHKPSEIHLAPYYSIFKAQHDNWEMHDELRPETQATEERRDKSMIASLKVRNTISTTIDGKETKKAHSLAFFNVQTVNVSLWMLLKRHATENIILLGKGRWYLVPSVSSFSQAAPSTFVLLCLLLHFRFSHAQTLHLHLSTPILQLIPRQSSLASHPSPWTLSIFRLVISNSDIKAQF
jgi:hypothetical protein